MAEGFRQAWLGAASRLRRELRSVTASLRECRGRLGVEIGLALVGSEQVRGVLAEERAALRRVATLVA